MRPLLFFLFACLLARPATLLAGAEPYGKNLIVAGASWPAEQPLAVPGLVLLDAELGRETVALLEQRVTEQELEQGPYAPVLAESLADLARAFDALGETGPALAARERALHLIRLNEGLYSEAQGPLVRDILSSLRRSGDFAALDDRYGYFYRLYGAGQPPWDRLRWAATMEYLRWQREALRRELGGNDKQRLLALYEQHEALLETLRLREPPEPWERHRDVTLSQLKTLYLIDDRVEPAIEFGTFGNERRRVNERNDFDVFRERLENLQRTLRGRGRSLLESLLDKIPPEQQRARAEVQLALADWLLWQGSSNDALEAYEALWAQLHREGLEAVAQEWFHEPVPLPDNGVFLTLDTMREGPFLVDMEVSEKGIGRGLVVALDDAQRRRSGRLRRSMNALRFRPAMRDGKPVPWRLERVPVLLLDPG